MPATGIWTSALGYSAYSTKNACSSPIVFHGWLKDSRYPAVGLCASEHRNAGTLAQAAPGNAGCAKIQGRSSMTGASGGRERIKSEAFSAIIIVVAQVLAEGIVGITDASTTRKPCMP